MTSGVSLMILTVWRIFILGKLISVFFQKNEDFNKESKRETRQIKFIPESLTCLLKLALHVLCSLINAAETEM